jgi:acetylornithine deacetylase
MDKPALFRPPPAGGETLALLDQLVAFDTAHPNGNLALIEFARDRLEAARAVCRLVPDATGTRAGLIARLGPADVPALVLSGHTDVVPVTGQAWTSDPFRLTVRGGRAIGRGATDMKGYVAASMALALRVAPAALQRPVILALSYDEEIGCKGAPPLGRALLEDYPRPWGCVVGEPSELAVVDGHKSKVGAKVTVIGREGHSSLTHRCVNAVTMAARLVDKVAAIGERLATEGPFLDGFEPAHTTASVGRIEGGSQLNIVPGLCTFEFEFRGLPGTDPALYLDEVRAFARERLVPAMQAVHADCDILFEELLAYPGFLADPGSEVVKACLELTQPAAPRKVAYGTEAGCYAALGIPSVVCGPGSIVPAHRPDEWIALDQLEGCDRFLDRLVSHACSR